MHSLLFSISLLFCTMALLLFIIICASSAASYAQVQRVPISSRYFSAQEPFKKPTKLRLANPLIGEDKRVYVCSEKFFFAFEKNGSIAWTIPLNYTCSNNISPVHGASRKIYVVAENRVLVINPLLKDRNSEVSTEVFFGPEAGDIIGLAVSISSSCLIINVKKRGLFAYRLYKQLLWSAGPVLYQHGYRQGCSKNMTNCYFSSVPIIDHCEASIYIANNKGELYSLSIRSPRFKWIQDLSVFDKKFTVTAANNGLLYVTLPVQALVLALDVSTGDILWQQSIGPLSSEDYSPAVDSNGWISIGSLDGYLYSFSPKGILNKYPKEAISDSVIQVSPFVDCSGYGVYVSQTQIEGKVEHKIGDYTFISALKPKATLLTLLVPAITSLYWSERYPPGQFVHNLSQSDLSYFELDESVLLAFISVSSIGNPLPCRTARQKFASSCSQARRTEISTYTGNEKAIMVFLLFETTVLIILAAIVRYCFILWNKKKLQSRGLVKFLEKRQSLRQEKKAIDRTISEVQEKAVTNDVLEEVDTIVKERQGILKKLSTTYSLGRDTTTAGLTAIPSPLNERKSKSFSFQGFMKKENVTIFHTLSDTSSSSSSDRNGEPDTNTNTDTDYNDDTLFNSKPKGKAPMEVGSSTDDETSND